MSKLDKLKALRLTTRTMYYLLHMYWEKSAKIDYWQTTRFIIGRDESVQLVSIVEGKSPCAKFKTTIGTCTMEEP